ncbi:MAG: DUF1156 domain-containing protein [Terriglobia bacterium]|jgi:putative DNA methylase
MSNDDRRLIEDYLPIEAISKEASREKSVRKGHISTLHLWWARRPLVACRAAVYGALVPARRFRPKNGPEEKRESLTRANAAKFVERLCKYPGDAPVIAEAQRHILEAHAERLTHETGKKVTVEDIVEGRAPRPKVLDMFAGGGAIPLEALRLGCEAYALDLNPVAHIIELCTLVYPQKYGKPDKNNKGSAEDGTWAGLAEEVRHWGNWVLDKVKAEIGDLYPPIPDPKAPKAKRLLGQSQLEMAGEGFEREGQQEFGVEVAAGYLTPIAYLWTRTVQCKNPACGATVPLVRQTWLCKKNGRYVALRIVARRNEKKASFEMVEAAAQEDLGFDPAAGSESGSATCRFCRTVADSPYVQQEGIAGRVGYQLLAVICRKNHAPGTIFLDASNIPRGLVPSESEIQARIQNALVRSGLTIPEESISPVRPSPNARGLTAPTRHGLAKFSDLFQPRQLLSLLVQCEAVRGAFSAMGAEGVCEERARAVASYLGLIVDRMADRGSSMCRWDPAYTKTQSTFGRPALPFVWDFSETNPFGDASGDMAQAIDWVERVVREAAELSNNASVSRGSALSLQQVARTFDAVITDPPYYDNVPYGDLSDFFYVWLKRSIGHLYPEDFSSQLTPKKTEATALSSRFNGDMRAASSAYETMMLGAFGEAARVLKPKASLVVVYAHKTTLGWSTLIDALRNSGFIVTEAWPLDTEFGGRLVSQESAALASSIFLVARKREGAAKGSYEEEVRPQLEQIVRERVMNLWEMGIGGADLVIAAVGAGLRAFTRFARVDYANGEEVPAQRFLTEVETVVLETILSRLSKEVGGKEGLATVDPATRFYILWRYTYRSGDLDAGEAIIFANGTHVELDGLGGLSSGVRALIEKEKGTYRLLDYTERGDDKMLGMPSDNGQPAPLIDALQRTLWLMEKRPGHLDDFLREAQPNLEQMRLVAQALAGSALKGKSDEDKALMSTTQSEQSALGKLLANWRALVEQPTGPLFDGRRA